MSAEKETPEITIEDALTVLKMAADRNKQLEHELGEIRATLLVNFTGERAKEFGFCIPEGDNTTSWMMFFVLTNLKTQIDKLKGK
jgi:hypothetical protein